MAKTGTPFPVVDPADVAKEDKALSGIPVTERAAKAWATLSPLAAAKGYGLTTKAERWNGRHAMAGWIILLLTGKHMGGHLFTAFAPLTHSFILWSLCLGWGHAHNAIPQGQLDPKVWGQWVITSFDAATGAYQTISEERASILAFHLHLGK